MFGPAYNRWGRTAPFWGEAGKEGLKSAPVRHEVGGGQQSTHCCRFPHDKGWTPSSSRPEDSHLRALPDPYVNLSIHTAPDVRPFPWQSCQCAAFLPTSCRRVSTASATTVRSPTAGASRTSRERVSCSTCRLNLPAPQNERGEADSTGDGEPQTLPHTCPCCGGRMIIIEAFERGCGPRYRPTVPSRVDSS
jgi:hypothetical protein